MRKYQLLSSTYFRQIIFILKKSVTTTAKLLLIISMVAGQVSAQQIQANAARQIKSLMDEKASRTPAQKKINSQILYAFKMDKGQSISSEVVNLRTSVKKDARGMIKIELDAVVTPQLLDALKALGSEVVFSSEKFGNIVANIPLDKVEEAALLDAVKHIDLWVAPMNNSEFSNGPVNNKTRNNQEVEFSDIRGRKIEKPASNFKVKPDFSTRAANIRNKLNKVLDKKGLKNNYFFVGTVTSEADATHKAALARSIFGVNGTGVKIGVLSDGVTGYATSQASGDLPPVITILPGQAGTGQEGRAMMELIYDLAPGAELYFATAFGSQAGFAQNILDLRTAGCDIIVDDITYFSEGVFQDDIIAQAVNTVTASGALYFSSAGNSGNKNDGTAGVWEGDFVDGGASAAPFPLTGNFHLFSAGVPYNVVTVNTGNTGLKWSDPLGLSGNDYDLFVTNAAGTVIEAAGTAIQDGNDNPYEQIGSCFVGERIYILKKTGAATRALHLNTNRGMITYNTPGVVYGHNAGLNTISVAATPASVPNSRPNSTTGPFPFPHNSNNKVEVFSSDGPRRIFYNPNGTEITPGNLLFGTDGGTVLQKPDLTAADGTLTVTPGFIPFFGTSASAPHVAAIAALVKSAAPLLTAAQIKAALIASCIDIETPGVDRDAGAGIVMAVEAIEAAGVAAPAYLTQGVVNAVEGSYGNGNGSIEPGELGSMTVQLVNATSTGATAVTALLTTTTPGVTITQNSANYGNIGGNGSATNTATPYIFGLNSSVVCGSVINFTLTVTYTGGSSPAVFNFTVPVGKTIGSLTAATLGGAPASGTGFTSASGLQTNRTLRNGVPSTCSVPKAAPGLSAGANLNYHAYTFTNSTSIAQCVTVTLASTIGSSLFAVAYNNSGFVAATPGANYLADAGGSNSSTSFSFTAPPSQAFTVVVHEVATNGGTSAPYTLTVNLVTCTTPPPCTPITLSPITLPNAVYAAPYSQSITATGGSGSHTYSLSGTLPTGLTLSSAGVLSGTPTQTGSFPISITANDAVCPGATINYTLVVEPILLTINDVTQNEGNSGTITFSFTVSLSAPAGSGGVTFDIATADNTATIANNDYVAKLLTSQTIPAGSSTYTFDVVVNGDVVEETDEDFFVNVTNATGAIVSDGQGLATISNDDFDEPTTTTLVSSLNPSCTGSDVTFTATVTSTGNPVTFGTVTFTEGATVLASNVALNAGGEATFTTSSLSATSHNITATYSGATGFITSNASILQNVNSLPIVTITPNGSTTFCAGESVELTSSAGASFLWSNGATLQSITVTTSGNYSVTVTDANGCSATSEPVAVTVNPMPNAVSTPSSQTICNGSAITSIVNSGNVAGTVYSWTRDNLAVTGIAANGTGNISGILTNSSAAPVTVTFTITPSYTNAGKTCTGTPIIATVTVNPNLYFACPGNMVQVINDVICFKAVVNPNPVFCGTLTKLTWKLTGATMLSSPTSGVNYVGLRNMNVGITTVKYTATFAGGVVKTCSYTVTVKETVVPEIRCPLDKDVTTDPGKCNKTGPISLGTPVVSDNCGVASVTNNAPAVYQKGVNLVTWTVTDKSGNTRTCVQRVTVYDAEKPTITCPANIVANTGSDCTATPVTLPHPVFADNCGVIVTLKWAITGVTWGSSNGTGINYVPTMNYATGVSTVTYTAYDEAGNWQTCTFTVTVKDVTPPVLVCATAQTFCKVANNIYTIPVVTQTDNCVIATTAFKITGVTSRAGSGTNASGSFNVGVSTIKWTVKDVNGNTSTCTTSVTILPLTNPACIITAPVTSAASEAEAKLSFKEVVLGLSVIAYPNPTENYFNLKINTAAKEVVEIRMFDMASKLVQTNRGAPGDIYRLGENVVSGMYIIEVTQAGKTVRTKVVKQ